MKGMMKKEGKAMDMDAKKASIMELLDLAKEMMKGRVSDDMKEMQKVTVAAPSKEKLLEGLDKAEDILEESPEMEDMEEYADMEEEDEEEELA